ncbi:MAG TPA: diguanylate cyclase [Anaerolineales bacterium]|jgi:diguanylate cyclase (GGDEF)-like protein|nr:diguanylate cyclase [Anaerolineales bacterium]HQX16834.1 diguanylate cyclase [Anaerolineales bacterium]
MAIILIIDKNPTERRVYTTLLGNYGHRFLEAEDGVQALEVARAELPDLIITDILMPTMDGFTLARRLRAEPLLMGIPVIFQTSNYDETEIHRLARASGVTHILRKPAEPQAILRAVNESLKNPTTPTRLPQTGQLQREHLQLLADKLYEKVSALEDANERLRNLSLVDGLTGLNNRRGFMILATNLLKFARRAGYSSSLIYIDLDSLKSINDLFGHAGGDAALVNFAKILTTTFHESDVTGRLGGDEFVALIVDASHSDLANIEARLQQNVSAYNQQVDPERAFSFSMGSIRVGADSTISMEEFLTQADEAMYKHKLSRKRARN